MNPFEQLVERHEQEQRENRASLRRAVVPFGLAALSFIALLAQDQTAMLFLMLLALLVRR